MPPKVFEQIAINPLFLNPRIVTNGKQGHCCHHLKTAAGGDVYCFIIRKLPNAHQTDRKEALMTGIMALLDEVKHIGEDLGQLLFNGSHPTKWRHLPITERESSEAVWF